MCDLPTISVVVPCHNAEKFLSNALLSLDAQTYENLQIILVDDSSDDNTFSIISKHAEKNDKYLVVKAEGKGVSAARNTGIDKAVGEYVTFMDCDDYISPYHVEFLVRELLDKNADCAVIDYIKVPEGKKYQNFKFKKPKDYKIEVFLGLESLKEYLAQLKFEFCVWNKLYSKKILDEFNVRFMVGCQYNEDSLFNYKYFKNSQKTVLVHALTYYYVQRKNSLVHLPFNVSKLDAFYSLNNIIKDAYETCPEIIHYAHIIRVALSCEILFYIKSCKYDNGAVIQKIIDYISVDCKHLKYCKKTHRYRRVLIPLVPPVAKFLLCVRRKKGGELLPQFLITDK